MIFVPLAKLAKHPQILKISFDKFNIFHLIFKYYNLLPDKTSQVIK